MIWMGLDIAKGKPMQPQPSELFLGSIQRGYDRVVRFNKRVTPGDLWNEVIRECTILRGGFAKMFEWDPLRPNERRNRVKLIADCIAGGLVPGLVLAKDRRGREVVVRAVAAEAVPDAR